MKLWSSDEELSALVRRELFTAVVGDVMDKLNLRRQFLPPQIRPLREDMVVFGRAMPVLEADTFADSPQSSANPVMAQPFGLMLSALDDLKPGEVYICTGGSPTYALWGELMSTRAMILKSAGAGVGGYFRGKRREVQPNFSALFYWRFVQEQRAHATGSRFLGPLEKRHDRCTT